MKKLILIAAIVAMTVTSSAPALSAAAPTAEQCKNATDPGNISPQVSTESNGQTLEVRVSGAYGLNSKQRRCTGTKPPANREPSGWRRSPTPGNFQKVQPARR